MSGCNKHEREQTILVVDDEIGVIHAFEEALLESGHRLIATTDPHHALEILGSGVPVDLLVTDLFMLAMSGARLLSESKRIRPGLEAILLTGVASPEEFNRWRRRGQSVVLKPWTQDELVTAVNQALARSDGRRTRVSVV